MDTGQSRKGPSPGALTARVSIPARGAFKAAALDFAETLAGGAGFDGRERRHIRLAVEEVLEFIGRTALGGESDEGIDLVFEVQADGLRVRLTEKGLPLDLRHLPGFSAQQAMESDQADGLSLHLAREVVDGFELENRGREGMSVVLFKKRSGGHVMHRMGESAPAAAAAAAEPDGFEIRPAREEEALEIARCAYLTYGYTYEDYIYYPERIAEMNRRGELRSLVAVAGNGAVAGHCARKALPGRAGRAELGVLFVRPEYRRHGLGAALWGAVTEQARADGLESLISRSVTGHRASQAMAMHHGFQDCALYLSLFPRAVDLKDLGGVQAGKMSGMLQWLGLGAARERRLDVPVRHEEMVVELYRGAGLTFKRMEGNAAVECGEAQMKVKRTPVLNVADLEVTAIGPDPVAAAQGVAGACRRLCRQKVDTIYLYLPLEQAGAAAVAEACTQEGFLFSGIAPDALGDGDALVLQYLNSPEDPFAQMITWTPTAERLREYIRREWQAMEPPVREE